MHERIIYDIKKICNYNDGVMSDYDIFFTEAIFKEIREYALLCMMVSPTDINMIKKLHRYRSDLFDKLDEWNTSTAVQDYYEQTKHLQDSVFLRCYHYGKSILSW